MRLSWTYTKKEIRQRLKHPTWFTTKLNQEVLAAQEFILRYESVVREIGREKMKNV